MSEFKLIFQYSLRIVVRQWRRFVLPFISLFITTIVLILVLLITQASTLLLSEQSRSLLGGDVVLESTSPIDSQKFWQVTGAVPDKQSNQISFSGTLQSNLSSSAFSVQVVDDFFPLYGSLVLKDKVFTQVKDSEIYLDQAGAEKLQVSVGDSVSFGSKAFIVSGIITTEPTSLFGGFRFLPRAIISQNGFLESKVDPKLLRAEYIHAAGFSNLSSETIKNIRAASEKFKPVVDVDIAGQDQVGLQFGLKAVSNFLIIAVLITAVLSAVNVYASTLYLVSVEKRNLAVLLALGLRKRALVGILSATLGYIVLIASVLGIVFGSLLFFSISSYVSLNYLINLPIPNIIIYSLVTISLIVAIVIASLIPAVAKTLALNPKQILIGAEEEQEQKLKFYSLIKISLFTLLPLVVFASFLLKNIVQGIISILAIGLLYIVVAGVFSLILFIFYKKRAQFSFFIRSIISQKKADGFFGIISFTSLFIALVAIGSLALTQLSLEKYLIGDLAQTVPTTYVLDIQPSQKDLLTQEFPGLVLYKNIRARILAIDSTRIQDELAKPNTEVDRELGREFNLTSRTDLLSNEAITAGVWSGGKSGEVSVDENFAKRANIKLGSKLTFSIQGFEVSSTVTSLRKTDSRSGLPFFFFVLSPQDLSTFPAVYFGYSYFDTSTRSKLEQFVANNMPNISILNTQAIGPQIIKLVQTLLVLVLIITLPPLLIATLLIATLVVSSYESRRREGARLRAIGATKSYVLRHYLIETIFLTLVSAVFSYLFSIIITFFVNKFFLRLSSSVFFDAELVIGLGLIVLSIGCIGLYLFKSDTMKLRELLSYESNL